VNAGAQTPSAPKRIGDILVELGYATEEQIERGVKRSIDQRRLLGKLLVEDGIIDEVQLSEALSVRLGVGFTTLSQVSDIDPEAVAKAPERLARRYTLIPTKIEGGALCVAMSNPSNVFAIDAVRSATGYPVKVFAAPESAVLRALDRHHGFDMGFETEESAEGEVEVAQAEASEGPSVEEALSVAGDAPVVKYVDSLISRAIHDRASDIHIEPARQRLDVRLRIDGKLRPTTAPPKSVQNAVISRIKILANLDIAEKRLPLDGRLHVKYQGREVDLRVSTLPSIHGEKVVLRVLDRTALKLDLDSLGADDAFVGRLRSVLGCPNGIILVTGPTGSGKSTTLYACLNRLRDVTRNIVTVEDPVEYEIEGITQVAARPDIGLDFARALRSILRQDPDVVMVGEIRDLETLQIAIRASLTGHLVLSTLHTNDAVSSVTRLVNMGAEPYLIAATLLSAIAQRLVRVICEECKEEYAVADSVRSDIRRRTGTELPKRLWRGAGCAICGGSGYFGRSAVFEDFEMDEPGREMIARGTSESELRYHQRERSTPTLLDNALANALAGVTTLEEALQFQRHG